MISHTFSKLSKTDYTSLYLAIRWPQMEYVMASKSPDFITDISHLERIQSFATRPAISLRYMLYEERPRQLNLLSLLSGRSRPVLIQIFTFFKFDSCLRPSRSDLRTHLQNTARSAPSAVKKIMRFVGVLWNAKIDRQILMSSSVHFFSSVYFLEISV